MKSQLPPVSVELAIGVLVDFGVTVTQKGWSVYRSDATGYTLINTNSKASDFEEESFEDIRDAVAKFVLRTGL